MKLDQDVKAFPILRSVPFLSSGVFSHWPGRLMELDSWQRPERDEREILREYDDGWYRDLLGLWESFSAEVDPSGAKPATVLRFFYRVIKEASSEVDRNKAIYGASQESYLFSVGDDLLVGDLTLGNMIHLHMVLHFVDKYLSQYDLHTVVEPGCGTGINLFYLYSYLDIDRIVGGDICSNAVALTRSISQRYSIPGGFHLFDYAKKDSLIELTQGLENYLLITCHSIEQTQVSQTGFVKNVLNLPNSPRLVLHFEPMVWDDQTLIGKLCRRYAEKNRYNLDLLETLSKHQNEHRLQIIEYQKRCFGINAFNPTSFLAWEPIHQP